MDDHKRLDELRRRVEKDPASIAFASLAEELRKSGRYDEAVHVCRAGLERHPTYLSARVTLGRTLLALQQYGEARTEIEYVLHAAPDNLLALKCMNELQGLDGNTAEPAQVLGAGAVRESGPPSQQWPVGSPSDPTPAKAAGPHVQPSPEPPKPDLRVQAAPEPPKVEPPSAAPVVEVAPEPAAGPYVPEVSEPPDGGPPAEHPAIADLEAWQARIEADRAKRTNQ